MSLTLGFASILSTRIEKNTPNYNIGILTQFSLPKPLPMRLDNFIDHFLYQLNLQEDILVNAFFIVENFLDHITQNNIHKIVFTALALVYKFFTDSPVANNCLEKIGLLKKGELGKLELVILENINWTIKFDDVEEVYEKLANEMKKKDDDYDDDDYDDDYYNEDDDETNYTEYGSNCSFSEISAFFTK
ncbi:hypothetical protein SteCoe_17589 [Stentor coeruleus]|uniref:Cyclin N-terminal domain-containing protein n=1 Tax=Stentor coeruleus TaxID=5963 RepID=A0A1R2BYL9_9CILI|nr:hypothetical protein SteCoe_17589 [Stentor coeruleus]